MCGKRSAPFLVHMMSAGAQGMPGAFLLCKHEVDTEQLRPETAFCEARKHANVCQRNASLQTWQRFSVRAELTGTMGKIDPDKERARLAARYAAMTELELQKVGRDPTALTEWARDALHEEMSKRGLQWKAEVPTDEQAEAAGSDLPVVLRRYRDMPAAFI